LRVLDRLSNTSFGPEDKNLACIIEHGARKKAVGITVASAFCENLRIRLKRFKEYTGETLSPLSQEFTVVLLVCGRLPPSGPDSSRIVGAHFGVIGLKT